MKNVVVVGSWHLGSVVGACLADAGNRVSFWDQNPRIAEKWQVGIAPIHEPGLQELVKKHWNKNLFWARDLAQASQIADWVVLAYDTPINEQDEIMLDTVDEGFDSLLTAKIKNSTNFFFTAQLPVSTSRRLQNKVQAKFPEWHSEVMYQPENLRLGDAINCFKNPDRMVLGIESLEADKKQKSVEAFTSLLQNTKTPLNVMSLESAEMVKHALNSFLATCVVFANEISDICEKTGADAWDVVTSLKQDSRVGPKAFLRPGLGFAGGTLARDVKTLSHQVAKTKDTNFFSDLYTINEDRNKWVVIQLKENLGTLKNKKIILLGVTYKAFTSTVRRSPALAIATLLKNEGAICVALDPMADLGELTTAERDALSFTMQTDANLAFAQSSAAVLVTEWPQFKELHWKILIASMKTPLVIDTKSFLAPEAITSANTIVPGKPQRKSAP